MESLEAALLQAGARIALATIGAVDDAGSRAVMTDFYRRLWTAPTTDKVAALWAARIAARAAGEARNGWSGWVVVGE